MKNILISILVYIALFNVNQVLAAPTTTYIAATTTPGCLNVTVNGLVWSSGSACGSGGGGSVNSVTGTYPVISSGGTNPNISLSALATTTATCSGTVSCSQFFIIGSTPVTITGASGTSASSTLLGDNNSFTGKDTFSFASTTQLTLNGLVYDIANSKGTNGFVLESTANGTLWVATTTFSTGLSYSNGIVTNTAPDQTVVLSNGTGISVTGTYPNFTITNTSPSSGGTVTGTGLSGMMTSWSSGSAITSTSTLVAAQIFATSTASSTFAGGIDAARFCISGTTTCLGASSGSGLTFSYPFPQAFNGTSSILTFNQGFNDNASTSFSGTSNFNNQVNIANNTPIEFGGGSGNPTDFKTGTDGTALFQTGTNQNLKFRTGCDQANCVVSVSNNAFNTNLFSVAGGTGNATVLGTLTVSTTTATSTFGNGINLTGGCITYQGGACLGTASSGGSGTVSPGVIGQLGWYSSSGTTIVGSSTDSLTMGRYVATSTASSTFTGGIDATRVCITGTTTCLSPATGGGVSSVSGLWPIVSSSGASPQISWGGLATSTGLTPGSVLYATDVNAIGQVATSSVTAGASIFLNHPVTQIGAVGASITCLTASFVQAGCISTSDYSKVTSATSTFSLPLVYTIGTNAVTCPTCNVSNASVSSIATNNGLTGGTITTTGTLGLDTSSIVNGLLLQYNGSRLAATGTQALTAGYYIATTSIASQLPYASTTAVTISNQLSIASTTPTSGLTFNFGSSTPYALTQNLQNGYIGLGTTSPMAPFTLVQTGGLLNPDFVIDGQQNGVGAEMVLNRANTSGTEANIDFNTAGVEEWQLGIQNNNTNNFEIWDGNDSPFFTINQVNGDVGIGTSTPYSELTVWGEPGTNLLELVNNASSTKLTVDQNGNFGLGSTSPGSIFAIQNILNAKVGTSTWQGGGIDFVGGGCVAVNGVCIGAVTSGGSGSGTVSSGLAGQLGYYNAAGTTVVGTSTNPLYLTSVYATSTAATSTFLGGLVIGNNAITFDPSTGTTTMAGGIVTGNFRADNDAGLETLYNLPLVSTARNTPEGYDLEMSSLPALQFRCLADGIGNCQAINSGFGTSTPYAQVEIWASSTIANLFQIVSVASTTLYRIDKNGIVNASSTAPTVSSGVVDGTNMGGWVNGCSSACTLTFANGGWTDLNGVAHRPACLVDPETGSLVNTFSYAVTATTIVVTETGLGNWDYHCGIGN